MGCRWRSSAEESLPWLRTLRMPEPLPPSPLPVKRAPGPAAWPWPMPGLVVPPPAPVKTAPPDIHLTSLPLLTSPALGIPCPEPPCEEPPSPASSQEPCPFLACGEDCACMGPVKPAGARAWVLEGGEVVVAIVSEELWGS